MCGRFALKSPEKEIEALFDLDDLEPFPPRYNIAPTQPIIVVATGPERQPGSNRSGRMSRLVRWGLIPSWIKDPKDLPLLFNARSETAATKPSFRGAMRHRRALIPASGFYEWKRSGKADAQPYWVRPVNGDVVAFAGLWESWLGADGSEVDTGAILTTDANSQISHIHHRMPVVIRPGDFERWLDCRTQEPRDVADLLQPVEPGFFEAIPVSRAVNKVANTGSDVQQPIDLEDEREPAEGSANRSPGDGQMTLF